MRIRSTKPEFWRSHRIASVSWDARLVLKGLESYVDDNGVGKDDVELIIGDLFQRDAIREPSRTLARVSEAISELNQAGLVWRYESEGTNLLYVGFWESIQRVDKPQPGRMPRPDGTLNYKESLIRECVANPRESSRDVAPGTGEQGNRGTGEQGQSRPPVNESTYLPAKRVGDRREAALVALNNSAHSPQAHSIAVHYSKWLERPIDGKTLTEVAVAIDELLDSEIDPHQIADGIKAWHGSDSWSPTQIRRFVHKAGQAPQSAAVGKPTQKARNHLSVAEQIIAEMETA